MTSLPFVVAEKPLGIIIKAGKERATPVRFWAYLWASDEDGTTRHWHEQVPVGPVT